jgi:translation initiation factor IF-2
MPRGRIAEVRFDFCSGDGGEAAGGGAEGGGGHDSDAEAGCSEELTLRKGQVLEVLERPADGWWIGRVLSAPPWASAGGPAAGGGNAGGGASTPGPGLPSSATHAARRDGQGGAVGVSSPAAGAAGAAAAPYFSPRGSVGQFPYNYVRIVAPEEGEALLERLGLGAAAGAHAPAGGAATPGPAAVAGAARRPPPPTGVKPQLSVSAAPAAAAVSAPTSAGRALPPPPAAPVFVPPPSSARPVSTGDLLSFGAAGTAGQRGDPGAGASASAAADLQALLNPGGRPTGAATAAAGLGPAGPRAPVASDWGSPEPFPSRAGGGPQPQGPSGQAGRGAPTGGDFDEWATSAASVPAGPLGAGGRPGAAPGGGGGVGDPFAFPDFTQRSGASVFSSTWDADADGFGTAASVPRSGASPAPGWGAASAAAPPGSLPMPPPAHLLRPGAGTQGYRR